MQDGGVRIVLGDVLQGVDAGIKAPGPVVFRSLPPLLPFRIVGGIVFVFVVVVVAYKILYYPADVRVDTKAAAALHQGPIVDQVVSHANRHRLFRQVDAGLL